MFEISDVVFSFIIGNFFVIPGVSPTLTELRMDVLTNCLLVTFITQHLLATFKKGKHVGERILHVLVCKSSIGALKSMFIVIHFYELMFNLLCGQLLIHQN